MSEVYLADCPFCAGLAKKEAYDPYDGYQGNNTVYRIKCRKCGAEVCGSTYAEAVRKWNSRAAKLYAAKLQMGSPYGSALCKVPTMAAMEYVSITHRMLIEDNRAWDNLVVYESNGDCEKAVSFAESWVRHHPEERSEE